MKRTLIRVTVLAAFEPAAAAPLSLESLGDASAEMLRDLGALTAAADYDSTTITVTGDPNDTDRLLSLLDQHFPTIGLGVGDLPTVRMLGRNGLFRNARLTHVQGRLELWLGTAKERFPLLSFLGTPRTEK